MASNTLNMSTWSAKRIIGDNNTSSPSEALLQTGASTTNNIWILTNTNRLSSAQYGILYVYDTSTNGTADILEFYGGYTTTQNNTATDTPTVTIQLDNGDIETIGLLKIGSTLEVESTSIFHDDITVQSSSPTITLDSTASNNSVQDWDILNNSGIFTITNNNSTHATKILGDTNGWEFHEKLYINEIIGAAGSGSDTRYTFLVNGLGSGDIGRSKFNGYVGIGTDSDDITNINESNYTPYYLTVQDSIKLVNDAGNSGVIDIIYFNHNNGAGQIYPVTTNTGTIGLSTNRWNTGYFSDSINLADGTYSSIVLSTDSGGALLTITAAAPQITLDSSASGAQDWDIKNSSGIFTITNNDSSHEMKIDGNTYGWDIHERLYINEATTNTSNYTFLVNGVGGNSVGQSKFIGYVGIGTDSDNVRSISGSAYLTVQNHIKLVSDNISANSVNRKDIIHLDYDTDNNAILGRIYPEIDTLGLIGQSTKRWNSLYLYNLISLSNIISDSTDHDTINISTNNGSKITMDSLTPQIILNTIKSGSSNSDQWNIINNQGIFTIKDSDTSDPIEFTADHSKGWTIEPRLYINSAIESTPAYTFKIEGTSYLGGDTRLVAPSSGHAHLYMTGTASNSKNTTSQIVFLNGTSEVVAISAFDGSVDGIAINPSSSSNTGNILLVPGGKSQFGAGCTLTINDSSQTSYTFKVSGNSFLGRDTAASTSLLSSQLIVANTTSSSPGSVGIELYRGDSKGCWQILNDSGHFRVKTNYTSAYSATYDFTALTIAQSTLKATFAGAMQSNGGILTLVRETSDGKTNSAYINFQVNDTTLNQTQNKGYIACYHTGTADNSGMNMVIRTAGNVIIGGGESAASLYTNVISGTTTENLYCTADTTIYLEAGANTFANRKGIYINSSGNVIPCAAEAGTNEAQNLGSSSAKWATVYAVTFTGNAATATKLETARNINGTAFDGSAAITTSKWGTARNITISDASSTNSGTAVSVNGSAAVTLLLPSTIKASITGHASSDLALSGGTMTGVLTLKKNQYTGPSGNHGLDCNNSDIVNANGIFTADVADKFSEGINFKRTNGNWDCFAGKDGTFYFASNQAYDSALTGNAAVNCGAITCSSITSSQAHINIKNGSGHYLALQSDQNLVWYKSGGTALWQSGTATSSYLVKDNISSITSEEINNLNKLNVISFYYKPEMKYEDKSKRYGMIAEEVLPLFPNLVDIPEEYDPNKFDINKGLDQPIPGIKYEGFIPLLIKVVQNQQKEIETLKKQISKQV